MTKEEKTKPKTKFPKKTKLKPKNKKQNINQKSKNYKTPNTIKIK